MTSGADPQTFPDPHMRAVRDDSVSRGVSGLLAANQELGAALSQGLDLPLSALRASMESLCATLGRNGDDRALVDGVLEEFDRLGRNVRVLMELASPPVPQPLRCTAAEIALSARHGLPVALRARVTLARMDDGAAFEVDGPLLARVLHRLIENSLEAGSEQVLLIVRPEGQRWCFSVVDDAAVPFDADWAVSAFHSTKHNHLGLGLALAKRDLALIGGTLEFRRTHRGETCATVTIPRTAEGKGGI